MLSSQSIPQFSTLIELLQYRAIHQANHTAYTFLRDGEVEESKLTYQELDRQARAIAAQLYHQTLPGDRALLLYPPGTEFVTAFFGCLYAGVIAVPAYPPRANRSLSRLQAVVADAQAKIALTTTSILSDVMRQFAEEADLATLSWLTTDDVSAAVIPDLQIPPLSSDTLAFLQYTSGSTGLPKGVMVSHGNLLDNEQTIQTAFEHTDRSSVVGWLPLFHDMGLVGNMLQPLYVGIPCILMSPVAFLQRPFRWLQAISQYQATTSGGPNFAYDLCVQKITPEQRATLDLSSWTVAFNGAEPIRAETLDRFVEAFEPCGFRREAFYPCYGMAETTLLVSGNQKGRSPILKTVEAAAIEQNQVVSIDRDSVDQDSTRSQTLVGCGYKRLDHQVLIVNPETRQRCVANQTGEIWVSGGSVTQGYWNQSERTAETFQAYLADTEEGPFLRTGDLGFLQGDELFVTGRLKDLIIIRGRNHYPQDIELTVEQSHSALLPNSGAAFSVDVDGDEQLVVVQEIDRHYRKLNLEDLIDTIRQAIAEQHELQTYSIVLLKFGSIPKTSSGKIQRHACRTGFLANDLNVVHAWSIDQNSDSSTVIPVSAPELISTALIENPQSTSQPSVSVEALQAWLVAQLSQRLKVQPDRIDIHAAFARYGLDSKQAIGLVADLETWLGQRLSPTLVYDYPSIATLSQHLAGESTQITDASQSPSLEPIAIIGMGCRFPGGEDLEAFWQLLRNGESAITEVSPDRWNAEKYYDANPAVSGKMNTCWGGFLNQVDQFDPDFFGISPREADSMDPQQRLVLEVAWEALERAGQAPTQLAGSATGVFVGISSSDYARFQFSHPDAIDAYTSTSNAHSIVANRLSYFLDLRGPSLAVDTACSSSLVALHLACQSLRQGESQLAIAGGVNLILTPQLTIGFSQARMMAADGRCKTFDAEADGYVRGEGCGMVVLKRLSEAQRDGDPILAVIQGSAVNQDGLSNGLTAPNGTAQQAVIRQALQQAGVTPDQISYVETHGTGTALGDPIEVNALVNALNVDRAMTHPCWIGSVKTNIGHLEAAAGIAGLIKVVLSLQHQEVPAHLHLKRLNPQIPLEGTAFAIPIDRQAWAAESTRLAGVSSFSFGGTNAHVIVAEAPVAVARPSEIDRPMHLLTFSAKTAAGLQDLAQRYANCLETQPDVALADLCFSANTGRSHFAYRFASSADSVAQLQQQLADFVAHPASQSSIANQQPKLAFLFTGQGSQAANMGWQLYETQPTFRQTIDRCDAILRPYLELPLLEVLYPQQDSTALLVNETAYAQPALFALEYALAELWQSWGIEPDLVMGHSVGEYVAACVAGVFSLEDGLKLIAHRARLMQALPQNGSMAAVFAGTEQVKQTIAPYADSVAIAALNGPNNTVISGERSAVQTVLQTLAARGIEARTLNVSHAFHSPLMEPMLAEFAQIATEIHYAIPKIPLISNLTGEIVTAEITQPDYWCRHIRGTVQFATSLETLQRQAIDLAIELGAQPILIGMGRQCLPNWTGQWLPSLRKGRSDWQMLLESLATLYRQGVSVNWTGFDQDYQRQWQQIPTYPFQRERYWVDAAIAQPFVEVAPRLSQSGHPLLGQQLRLPRSPEMRFENHLSTDALPFLADHRVYEAAVLPATGYVEIALAAAASLGIKSAELTNLSIQKTMQFSSSVVRTLQLILTADSEGSTDFQLVSAELDTQSNTDEEWVLHATGKIVDRSPQPPEVFSLTDLQSRLQAQSVESYYERLQAQGLEYGPNFRAIQQLWRNETEAFGQIQLPARLEAEATAYQLHPVLLDACFQLVGATLLTDEAAKTYLPIGIANLHLYRTGTRQLWGYAQVRPQTEANAKRLIADLQLWDEAGPIATVEGLLLRHVPRRMLQPAESTAPESTEPESLTDWLYQVEWVPQALAQLSNPSSDHLLPPSAIVQTLQPQIAEWSAAVGLEIYRSLIPQMDTLSAAYAVKALRDLGCELHLQQRLSVTGLAQQFGVLDMHYRLLGRLLEILAEEGILQAIGTEWQVCQRPGDVDPDAFQQALLQAYPACEAELTLLGRCGTRLAAVLRGETDPLQLLFPAGSLTSAERLYQDSPAAQVVNRLVQQSIVTALEQLPSDRTVRILEIGAGTGGTTSYVLPHLPQPQTEYVFSDVSTLFTLKAQEKFCDYPFVQYEILDIEQDPQAQGLTDRSFDLILAANVLHATRDLRQTLQHVQQLLAPEGMLVLLEGAGHQRWLDLIFGLTDGWWRFTDTDLRPSYPLLKPAEWVQTLQEVGFAETVTLPEQTDQGGALSQQVVFLARMPQSQSVARSAQGRWLILDEELGVADALVQQLKDQGASVVTVVPGKTFASLSADRFSLNPADAAGFKQLLHQIVELDAQPLQGVVHLWSLRATPTEQMTPTCFQTDREWGCVSALHLVQALAQVRTTMPPRLWLVTQAAQAVELSSSAVALSQTPLWGMGKVINLEHPELGCVRLDLPNTLDASIHQALFDEIWSSSSEDQVALRSSNRYVARLLPYQSPAASPSIAQTLQALAGQPCQLTIPQRGTLDNLTVQAMNRRSPAAGEVEIQVQATGLNFLDVMDALGILPFERGWFGGECAGTIVAVGEGVDGFQVGDAVMAIAAGSFATFVTTDAHLVVHKPESLSFEQAATIPVTFLTTYYALHQVANLSAGDRVLIHAAAGGVGLAAVQLAQRAGAEIFATVGSPEKQDYLRSLGVQHLSNSRSIEFAEQVKAQTQGAGVTIVLNSLAGEFIPQSLSVMADHGHFLEIGKTNIWSEQQVQAVHPTLAYSVVDLVQLCRSNPVLIQSMFVELMQAFQQGQLTPLPCHVFPLTDVTSAFRYMAHAKHIGKIVVTQSVDQPVDQPTTDAPRPVIPVRADAAYLITGGLNGLGLLVAQWLIEQGARHLVLTGRSQPTEAAQVTLSQFAAAGVQVLITQADVADADRMRTVLAQIDRSMPPLRGVIHSAGVLNDGVLTQQDAARFAAVMAAKVEGAWNLHHLTQHQPLDFFVCFSSVAALLGSPGQANHAAANAFLDALAHHRRLQGLPGISINWGAWSNIGAAAKRNVGSRITMQGMGTIAPAQGLQILEQILQENPTQVGVLPVQWPKFMQQFPTDRIPAFLAQFGQSETRSASSAETDAIPAMSEFRQRLNAAPASDRPGLLVAHIREQVAIVLNHRSPQRIDTQRGFFDLGMDSLTAIELKSRLVNSLAQPLPSTLIFEYPTIEALATYLAQDLFAGEAAPTVSSPVQAPENSVVNDSANDQTLVANLEQLSEAEVEALLLSQIEALL